MVAIGGRPILWHIMSSYARFGHKDFYIALGYKAELVKEYFIKYQILNSDFSIDLGTGELTPKQLDEVDWQVNLVDTGLNSMTGGRVKRMQSFMGNEKCLLTYGDGVSDVDIERLIDFHNAHGKLVTITAVHPRARFGELQMQGNLVTSFKEKPQAQQGWVNGGFFVIEPGFFDLIEGDDTTLERQPLERCAEMGELMAYNHDGFWQCMDTKRDVEYLEELWKTGEAPWSKLGKPTSS
jgi:glucose-1-phosphate cytidylyltransferase